MLKRPLVLFLTSVIAGALLLFLGYLAGLSHTSPSLGRPETLLTLFAIVLLGFIGSVSGFLAFVMIAQRASNTLVKVLAIIMTIGYGFWIAGNIGLLLLGLIFNSNPNYG